MRRALIYSLLAALLGGCVVVPYGYRDDDSSRRRDHDGHYHYRHDAYPGYYGDGGFRHYDRGG